MHIFLFILYCLICGYGIVKLPYIRRSGIKPVLLLALFFIHVLTGCLHNVIAYKYFPNHGDIWHYFYHSFFLRHQMLTDFHTFITDWTWSWLTHENLMFIHIVLNCFSLDNLYINTLLFSFPVFLGNIALFRVFRRRFPGDLLPAAMIFLLPSVLFWTSCIHREALLYMLLGFLLSGIDRLLANGFQTRRFYACLLWVALIVFFRSAFVFSLLPALFIWIWLESRPARPVLTGLAIAAIAGIILLNFLVPGLTIPAIIAEKQREFDVLQAHSRIFFPVLDGTWNSLQRSLAYIVMNGLFAPLPGQGGQAIYLAFSLELFAIWAIVAIALVGHTTRAIILAPPSHNRGFALFCIVLALCGMLEIGATVPFVGAIVRYRSIYLPFLLAPFLHALRTLPLVGKTSQWLFHHCLIN
ncbi:MAG TPA: hypothetical protein VG605_22445 [Puia sp.]|nr:hypothetical protein [Puia sp.]